MPKSKKLILTDYSETAVFQVKLASQEVSLMWGWEVLARFVRVQITCSLFVFLFCFLGEKEKVKLRYNSYKGQTLSRFPRNGCTQRLSSLRKHCPMALERTEHCGTVGSTTSPNC